MFAADNSNLLVAHPYVWPITAASAQASRLWHPASMDRAHTFKKKQKTMKFSFVQYFKNPPNLLRLVV